MLLHPHQFSKVLLAHRIRCLFLREHRRPHKEVASEARQKLLGRLAAKLIPVEKQCEHPCARADEEPLLFLREGSPHKRNGRDVERMEPEDGPIAFDEHEVLGTGHPVEIEEHEALPKTMRQLVPRLSFREIVARPPARVSDEVSAQCLLRVIGGRSRDPSITDKLKLRHGHRGRAARVAFDRTRAIL